MIGAGPIGFTADASNDIADVGGALDARFAIGYDRFALEAAYRGSAQDLDSPMFMDDDATLMGNGAEANLRVNLVQASLIRPFVFAGVSRMNLKWSGQSSPRSPYVAGNPMSAGS